MSFNSDDVPRIRYVGGNADDEYEDSEHEFLETPGSDGHQMIPLLKETGGKMSLDEEALKSILNPKKLGERPIVVISIAGAFRMGKSFLLNLLLRYLQKERWQLRNESWLEGWSSSDQAIKWRGGAEGDTRGIMALKEPIMIERSNGEKLAVLLLDTQGNFDHGHSRESNVGIFAISTLFSSLQIFNISKQIQTNDIDYLQCFVEFAKISQPKKSSDVDIVTADHQECFFQDLLFLVRDWQNPGSHPYGTDGGESYLKSLSSCNENPALHLAFSKVRCFLMPEPSSEVRITEKEGQNLEAENLGKSFSRCLTELFKEFINPDTLKPKTLGFAGPVTAGVLFDHMKLCTNNILSGGSPEYPSLMKLIALHANTKALEEVEKKFIAQVEEAIAIMKEPSWAEFQTILRDEKLKAKKAFLNRTSFGREEIALENVLQPFLDRIEAATSTVKKPMQERRHFHMEQVIKTWMEESRERLKFREFPYTDVSELKKIRDARLPLLPNKDDEDRKSVATQLEKAEWELLACCEENVRDAEMQNKEARFILAGSAAAGIAVGGPIAAGGFLVCEAAVGSGLGLLAGAGVAWKMGRDGFQKMKEKVQQNYSRKDKTE